MGIERIVPGTKEWDAFYANHICRYQFAMDTLQDKPVKKILDAACGVGYGASFLAGMSGVNVTAIDRSADALGVARKEFGAPNMRFLEDDCHTLNAASAYGPFDAVVSFETLEHLPEPARFLSSCYNNLATGASLIISTPNQLVSSPGDTLDWEFHEKEYTPSELKDLLQQAGFKNITLYGQCNTATGIFRQQVRAELNRIHSNPMFRIGKWIQQKIKGHQFGVILPEQKEDFEVRSYPDAAAIEKEKINGPFVLIAVCEK